MIISRFTLCAFSLMAVTACGAGSGPVQQIVDVDEVPEPPVPTQQAPGGDAGNEDPLDEFGTEPPDEVEIIASNLRETLAAADDVDTALSGLVVVVDPDTGDRIIVRRDGVYDFDAETLTLAGAGLDLSSDIPGAFLVSSSMIQSDAAGIVGIATADTDMPLAGDAVFTGGAAGFVITSAAGFDLTNGQSLVTVNFASGSVTAELSDFVDISQVTENLRDAPIDQIVWRNAQIVGSGFSGGLLETRDDAGKIVDVTGGNTTFLADGQFFGLDAESLDPAEVGGLIYATGDEGRLFGSFIAD